MAEEHRRVVEIRGVKFDVDMREAITVESLRVGDRVSVLLKEYSSNYRVRNGVVVGFEPFRDLPSIVVAYLDSDFSGADVKVLVYNDKSEDIEIVRAVDDVPFDKAEAIRLLDSKIERAELELEQVRSRKAYFLANFLAYWKEPEEARDNA